MPSPGYVKLTPQAATRNLTGQVSNGLYGEGKARGWAAYRSGGLVPEGFWQAGDEQWATPDVASALEGSGGAPAPTAGGGVAPGAPMPTAGGGSGSGGGTAGSGGGGGGLVSSGSGSTPSLGGGGAASLGAGGSPLPASLAALTQPPPSDTSGSLSMGMRTPPSLAQLLKARVY